MKELGERELDCVAGGETAPVSNAAPTQIASQGNTGASPDFGWGYGRGWCYWHPYVCHK